MIPALNEARNLRELLPTLPRVHQVILVDGPSVDGTAEAARQALPGIEVLRQTRRGKGNALATGFEAVTGDVVVTVDADGSADPGEIPAFVEALLAGADVAKGTRYDAAAGSADLTLVRSMGNLMLNRTMNAAFGTRFTDLCYGYNAFWADLLPLLELPDTGRPDVAGAALPWGDGFEIETLLHCRFAAGGARIAEVPSVERRRGHGTSNLHALTDGVRVLRTIHAERRRARTMGTMSPTTGRGDDTRAIAS